FVRKIDRVWQLEYQRTEDEYRYRVIEADSATVYRAVRLTFLDLGLAIQKESTEPMFIRGESEAPTPLSQEEWLEGRQIEVPKLSELGWMGSFGLVKNPSDYIVTIQITMKSYKDSTFLVLDYSLDAQKLRRAAFNQKNYGRPTPVG